MSRYIALVPAAGVGSRFGAALPKQYVQIAGRTVLEHTLRRLLAEPQIVQVAVVLARDDAWFEQEVRLPENLAAKLRTLYCGGESRAESVFNGLNSLLRHGVIRPDDKVLVHDAARCCLPQSALNRLLDTLDTDPHAQQHGALLAIPVADTLKRQAAPHLVHSAQTIPREGIWQAQTPQAFQAALLHRALSQSDLSQITDDASAVEQLGLQPALVTGDSRNIKLTRPDDAALAEYFLQQAA